VAGVGTGVAPGSGVGVGVGSGAGRASRSVATTSSAAARECRVMGVARRSLASMGRSSTAMSVRSWSEANVTLPISWGMPR